MSDSFLATPKPAPNLHIPESKNIVKVSCIDRLPITNFLQPDYVGKEALVGPSFSFLVEHPASKPILFDLGIRKDWEVLPSYKQWMEMKWKIVVDRDVATILRENGVDVDGGAIRSIIWSHHHWDHVGDASTFPSSTELIVGPGFKDAHLPGYPKNKNSSLLETDFEGKELREVDFQVPGNTLKIGRFHAIDYFGDGSFYLLDTPGHDVGHICGLARVSSEPDSFIFMGGDAAHHGGEFRPTEYLPLPNEIQPSPLAFRSNICPGHLFQDIHPDHAADKPFYNVTKHFAHDKAVADWTVEGLGEFDAQDNVLLLIAHDISVIDPQRFDFYPRPLNDWMEKGIGKKVRWLFLGDYEDAIEAKEDGKEPFKWGKYP